jgi:hypothetical protein
MFDEDSYTSAVNAQWERLDKAQTNEELEDVLNTWPEKNDFIVEDKDDKDCDSNERHTVDN